jgi:hypothetical protein
MASIADLKLDRRNARKRGPRAEGMLVASLQEVGAARSIVIDEANRVLAGNGTVAAAAEAGIERVKVVDADGETIVAVRRSGLSEKQKARLALLDNRTAELAEWDAEMLASLAEDGVELDDLWSADELGAMLASPEGLLAEDRPRPSLADRFLVPPFSVLDARQGYWQKRKAAWLSLGIKSEEGRSEGITWGDSDAMRDPSLNHYRKQNAGKRANVAPGGTNNAQEQPGTSVFDPVLCELVYRWFCPQGGVVLDPFAGGSVRGITAALLGRQYVGVELRHAQIAANEEQAERICGVVRPAWVEGDAAHVDTLATGEYDLLFTCPPYADMEVYSDDPRDLSTMPYAKFSNAFRDIIARSCRMLKEDRFAVIVVGEVRDKDGSYLGFVPDTVRAFEDAGLRFYNDAVLVTVAGSLPVRVGKQFEAGRKLGKTHQNVLIFVKGDPKKATEACGPVDVSIEWPENDDGEDGGGSGRFV